MQAHKQPPGLRLGVIRVTKKLVMSRLAGLDIYAALSHPFSTCGSGIGLGTAQVLFCTSGPRYCSSSCCCCREKNHCCCHTASTASPSPLLPVYGRAVQWTWQVQLLLRHCRLLARTIVKVLLQGLLLW